jgi:1-acyl-sn-glycerol-3-phosphate acyltransferase
LPTNLRLLRVGIHLLYGALQVSLLYPLSGAPTRPMTTRSLVATACWSCWASASKPPKDIANGLESGLLVANHVSFVDIFLINALLPSAFVAKSDVARWPLIGWLARRNDTVFIERGKPKSARQIQQEIGAALSTGRRLSIFPEGTTSAGDRVLPFHSALFQAAIDAGAPIHALAIDYADAHGQPSITAAYIGDLSLLQCLRQILGSGGLRVRLRLAASFAPPFADRRHVAHAAHQAVAAVLRQPSANPVPMQSLRNAAAISP